MATRTRLTREDRRRHLIDVAWRIAREDGSDTLTLPRLAEAAGVTKPVVYDHFTSRNGLLAALYEDFDARQTAIIDEAIGTSEPTLEGLASIIAASYVDCVLAQGREIPGVLAGLAGSPELDAVKRDYQLAFIEKCRKAFTPFAGPSGILKSGLWAMLGAADALSQAAANGDITTEQAKAELFEVIIGMVRRA